MNSSFPSPKSNVVWHHGNVTAEERASRNRHRGAIVWFTGLSASGKSTLARATERVLFDKGLQVASLDGDNLRHGLCADLGFSAPDREENLRRAACVAQLLADTGVIVLAAFISPFRETRARIRSIAGNLPFLEVWCHCPIEVCEARDPKGLYRRARAGQIPEFTGIDSPYEIPEDCELDLRTDRLGVGDAVNVILESLAARGIYS